MSIKIGRLVIMRATDAAELEEQARQGRIISNRATDLRWWMPDGTPWQEAARFILGSERIDTFRERVTRGVRK